MYLRKQNGVTLVALIITIIVLLILVGISISMMLGNNGIINKVLQAKEATRGGYVQETVTLAIANNTSVDYMGGTKKTKAEVISQLHTEGNLKDSEVALLKENDIIVIGGITIDFSALVNASRRLLGDVYDSGDLKIGDKFTYSSNGQENWIVFGKDSSGNILITTETPINVAFTLHGEIEAWLKYESYEDSTYGLNCVCSGYGGTIQGKEVQSRSIKMEDINYVAGLTQKIVTENENTYNIQSFETYTFGTINDYSEKKVNYWYPILTGGTLGDGTGSGFWKKPTVENETTFKNNNYIYFFDNSDVKYCGSDTNDNNISATTIGLNTDNLKYIWGENVGEHGYSYAVANRSVYVYPDRVDFKVACVSRGKVWTGNRTLCTGYTNSGEDSSYTGTFEVRPVVVLPSNLYVVEVETGEFDLVS